MSPEQPAPAGNIISLSGARADKAGDCHLWSPREALQDLVQRIDRGEINPTELVVHYFEVKPDESRIHGFCAAGVTFPVHISLLEVAKRKIIHMWLGE